MKPPSRTRRIALWCCAALALVLLVFTYASALTRDTWPKGHPWHGIALAATAGFFAIQTRLHEGDVPTRIAAVVLPLVAVGAMMVAMG